MAISAINSDLKPFNTTISYKEASLGVLWTIIFGYGIYLITFFIDPILISMFNFSIFDFFSDLYVIQINPPNYLYYLSLGFSFLTNIPSCFGWFVGGVILGSYYKKKNAHFNGAKGSWKSFQIVIMAIELIFIGSAFYYLISYSFGINNMSFTLFFGGLLVTLFTLFITPGLWLSLSLILIWGIIGSKFTRPIKVPSPIKQVPKILIEPETKPAVAKPLISKVQVAKSEQTTEVKKSDVSVKIPTKPPIIKEAELIEEDLKLTEEILRTGICPKCENPFPIERLKMIQKGKDTFCPKCLQPVYTLEIKKMRDEIKKIFRVGVELLSEDKEKAKAFFQDALDLANKIRDEELIDEIDEIIRKID